MVQEIDCKSCNKQIQKIRGCIEPVSKRVIEGYVIDRCPLIYATEKENNLLQAYFEYKNGFLPNNGGWLQQPMKFSQAMAFIDSLYNKLEEQKNATTRTKYTDKING